MLEHELPQGQGTLEGDLPEQPPLLLDDTDVEDGHAQFVFEILLYLVSLQEAVDLDPRPTFHEFVVQDV